MGVISGHAVVIADCLGIWNAGGKEGNCLQPMAKLRSEGAVIIQVEVRCPMRRWCCWRHVHGDWA